MEKTLVDVRHALAGNDDAVAGLDLVEKNTVPLTALKMTEVDVLRKVWGKIQAQQDETSRNNMKDMLVLRLAECGQEASCASGRVARIVDSLSTFDEGQVQLRPLWALRQEMLGKASVLRAELSETNTPLIPKLRQQFTEDYVTTGLMTAAVLDAELASWGDLEED